MSQAILMFYVCKSVERVNEVNRNDNCPALTLTQCIPVSNHYIRLSGSILDAEDPQVNMTALTQSSRSAWETFHSRTECPEVVNVIETFNLDAMRESCRVTEVRWSERHLGWIQERFRLGQWCNNHTIIEAGSDQILSRFLGNLNVQFGPLGGTIEGQKHAQNQKGSFSSHILIHVHVLSVPSLTLGRITRKLGWKRGTQASCPLVDHVKRKRMISSVQKQRTENRLSLPYSVPNCQQWLFAARAQNIFQVST